MPNDLIQYAFVAGEISPKLLGRTDLEKYDLGVSLAHNWFVDYRGGLSTRPGQIFCEYVKQGELDVRLFPFQFAPDEANNYIIMLGHNYARFVQDGGYVLEGVKPGSTTSGERWVSIAGHGYAVGDWVKLDNAGNNTGRTLVVSAVDTNQVQFTSLPENLAWVPEETRSVSFYRVYTITTPWPSSAVYKLHTSQVRDLVRVTHASYPIYNLRRYDHTDWRIEQEDLDNLFPRPSNLEGTGARSGTDTYLFAVTAVFAGDEESLPAYNVTSGFNSISDEQRSDYRTTYTWAGVPGARYYRLYRGNLNIATKIDLGGTVGYLSKSIANRITELNGVPDFTRTPPIGRNPFSRGRIEHVSVLTAGTGYTNDSVVTATGGGGSGFVAYPVVSDGRLEGIRIISQGRGYTASVTISVTEGTGATFEVELGKITGTYPTVSGRFQQRQIYAATLNDPMTVWASRPSLYDNFDESEAVVDSDPYEFDLDSEQVAPIKHMVATRGGLLLMTQAGIWQLSGGNDTAVTPTNALASPHTYTGISDLAPIRIDTDIIYVDGKGAAVKMLTFNEYARVYSSEDISLLSNHFFSLENQLTSWTFAEAPFRTIWGTRMDGSMLALAVVKEQKVFAWTQHHTYGYYRNIEGIQEGERDSVYMLVDRFLLGRWIKVLELQAPRSSVHVEDAWAVDCGLKLEGAYQTVTLQVQEFTGTSIMATASAAVFNSDHVGWVIRGGGGKMVIKSYLSSTQVIVDIKSDIDNRLPEDLQLQRPSPFLAGEWTLDKPVSTLGGLWHLEGATVSILADGNVMPPAVVTNGVVNIGAKVTRCIIGFGYRCVAKTLPPTATDAVIEHRRKSVPKTAFRVNETRGIKAGASMDTLYETRTRTNEAYGTPVELFDGFQELVISGRYDPDAPVYYVQDNPLPATILTVVKAVEVGDDPE